MLLFIHFSIDGLEKVVEDESATELNSGVTVSYKCTNASDVLPKEYKNFAVECFNGNWYNLSPEPEAQACLTPVACKVSDFKESKSYMTKVTTEVE